MTADSGHSSILFYDPLLRLLGFTGSLLLTVKTLTSAHLQHEYISTQAFFFLTFYSIHGAVSKAELKRYRDLKQPYLEDTGYIDVVGHVPHHSNPYRLRRLPRLQPSVKLL